MRRQMKLQWLMGGPLPEAAKVLESARETLTSPGDDAWAQL